jgi:hypothetical protein
VHSLVLVAGENVDSILLPYSSNEVAPHEVALEPGEVDAMAAQYRVPAGDLNSLAAKIQDYFGEQGFERDGRLFRVTRENTRRQFEWYQQGGQWAGFLKLNEPRPTRRFLGLLAGPVITHVDSARKHQIDQAHLLADPPAGLVREGQWRSAPVVRDGAGSSQWQREFASLFAAIPGDTWLHCVDIHN